MIENLVSLLDGDAPFPRVNQHVRDSEWSDVAEYGTVVWAEYPRFEIAWEDGSRSTEKVRY